MRARHGISGQKRGTWRIPVAAMCALFLILAGAVFAYVRDGYSADADAVSAMAGTDGVCVERLQDGSIAFLPSAPVAGFIFYPGGKVEHTAYAPLMDQCARQGILCVLVKMPLNLAVLDPNAADGIREQFPQVSHWYLGGHSLGGAMAASYISRHAGEYDGLVLLAAYSTADLRDAQLRVLSAYGTLDGVLDFSKYAQNRENLPASTRELILQGGCHANFGSYGAQKGDGTPTIFRAEQIEMTAEAIGEMILEIN